MRKIFWFSLVLGLVLALPTARAAGQVYISAVQTSGGTGHSTNDFVELFNAGPGPFNLNGVKLVKRTAHGTADTVLKSWGEDTLVPAYGFYLWANSAYSGIAVPPDAVTSGSIADDNGIGLRLGPADSGQLLDSLAWGSANDSFSPVSANIPANSVLVRQDLFGGNASYEIVAGFAPRNSSARQLPDETEPPAEEPPPVVVPPVSPPPVVYLPLKITEILPNPIGADSGSEAVELFNPNNEAVDLAGWFLGDGLTVVPASNAYVLSGTIPPAGYKSIVIPSGKFALNNTGGETVQLFSPAKKVIDSVTYSGTAKENQSFQEYNGFWSWQTASLGSANAKPPETENPEEGQEGTEPKVAYGGISINEFYPAYGEEFAGPMVELANTSKTEIDLEGWQIDVAATHLKKPSDTAFAVTGTNTVPAGGLSAVALTNINSTEFEPTGKYWVILYSPDGKHQDAVNLKSIVPRMSFAKIGSFGWQWSAWSHAEENKPFSAPALHLTEILPAYKDAETDAFVELHNPGSEPAYLGNLKIKVGAKAAWLPDYFLQPGEYYALSGEDLPAALTPAGKKVTLSDANDKTITAITYAKGKDGLAYMARAEGKWAWTSQPTPAGENAYKPPVAAVKASAKPAAKPAAVAKPPAAKAIAASNSLPGEESPGTAQKGRKPVWVFGILAGVLLAAAAVVWYSAKEPDEIPES